MPRMSLHDLEDLIRRPRFRQVRILDRIALVVSARAVCTELWPLMDEAAPLGDYGNCTGCSDLASFCSGRFWQLSGPEP